jgi:hypothetical protein
MRKKELKKYYAALLVASCTFMAAGNASAIAVNGLGEAAPTHSALTMKVRYGGHGHHGGHRYYGHGHRGHHRYGHHGHYGHHNHHHHGYGYGAWPWGLLLSAPYWGGYDCY